MQQWWYLEGRDRQGPFSQVEFERLVASHRIDRQTSVWTPGLANWVRLADLPAIVAQIAAEPARDTDTVASISADSSPCPYLASRAAEPQRSRLAMLSVRYAAAIAAVLFMAIGGGVAIHATGWIGKSVASAPSTSRQVWVNPLSEKKAVLPAGWQVVASASPNGEKVYIFKHEASSIQVLFASDPGAAGLQPADYAAHLTQSLFQNVRFETPRYLGKIGERDVFESLGGQGQTGADGGTVYFNVIADGNAIWRTVALSNGESVAAFPGFRDLRSMLLQSL